jgi:DNA-binding CsgD family transcriptional regulator
MLVGRDLECARLESLIDATRARDGGAVLLRGLPGSGKSALLDFAAGRAEDLMVLRAGGIPGEAEVAFAGVLEVLRPLLHLLPELPRPQREALGGALGLVPAVERDRFLVGVATLGLLLAASAERPVLACVDDVHWLDTPSLEALVFAGHRLAGAPVAMILAARDEPVPALDAARLEELPIELLDREATGLLASQLFGHESAPGEMEEIFRRTRGLPLAIAELSRLGELEEGVYAPVPISALVERAYARGVEAASEQVRALLLLAAADDSSDVTTLLAAAERLEIAAAALEDAEELGLIEIADGRIRFRHPLVRSAIYQSAAAPFRRRAHRALAACLTGEWQADRRAWHRAAGVVGPDEQVAAELAAMAERTRARSGYAVAARALERAAQLSPAPEARVKRAIAAADAFWRAGRGSRAEQLLTDVLAQAPEPQLRADAEHLLGRLAHFRGDPLAAHRILVAGALCVEREDRLRAAGLIASALHSSWFCGLPGLVRETAATAVRLATSAGVDQDARLCASTGAALTICERLDAAEPYLRRSIELAQHTEAFSLAHAANSHGWLCEYRAACDAAARALNLAHEQGAEGSVAFASELLSEYQCVLGEFDAAEAVWTSTVRVGEETGQPQVIAWSRLHAGYIAANRGGDEEVLRLVDSARQLEVPLWFIGANAPAWVLGTSALARGDGETAATLLAQTELDICQANYTPWTVGADLVEAYVRSGKPALAAAALDALAPHAHQAWAHAALDRARGMFAAEDEFDAPLERSAATFADLGVRLEQARSRLCHGERLRRAGRRVQARAQLRTALTLFERMRCTPWIERTESELRASGETLRARGPGSAVDELTPQELQVATLAASGLSNKEIATRLFLSIKTIEAHLHRSYRKLGVRSRAELAPFLGKRDPDASHRTHGTVAKYP